MNKKIEAVKKFHSTFGLGHQETPKADIGDDKKQLRYNLMAEENGEYLEAARSNDIVEIADALGDMLYVLCGTIIEHGLQDKIDAVFNEIQNSNMSKLGKNGRPIYRPDGKVLKGAGFIEPDIKKIVDHTP